jgi:predicted protein tyrosine phosphatase
MSLPQIKICSHRETKEVAPEFFPSHVVFIRDYKSTAAPGAWPWSYAKAKNLDLLDLQFDDRWEPELDYSSYPSTVDILRLHAFVSKLDSSSKILFTCTGGISRSSACALFTMAVLQPNLPAQDVFNQLLSFRPPALPNPFLLELAARCALIDPEYAVIARAYRKKFEIDTSQPA